MQFFADFLGLEFRPSLEGVSVPSVFDGQVELLFGVFASGRELEVRAQMPDFRLAVGARLVFADTTPDIVAYPMTRFGWGRLTRLLTLGNRRAVKGDCILHFDDLLAHGEDLLLIALDGEREMLDRLKAAFPGRLWLGAPVATSATTSTTTSTTTPAGQPRRRSKA